MRPIVTVMPNQDASPPAPPPPAPPVPAAPLSVEHIAGAPAASLKLVAKESAARNQPIKLRAALSLFNPATGQYIGWRGQAWKFAVKGVRDAQRAQQALEVFFDLIEIGGVERTVQELRRVKDQMVHQL